MNELTLTSAIDSHVHLWSSDTTKYPLATGYSVARMQPMSFTPEEFLAVARPCRVERAVLIQMDFYGDDNSYLLDSLHRFPGIFTGVAQIDEHGVDPIAELRRLTPLGVRGVRIAPPRPGDPVWLEDAGMQSVWRFAETEQIVICPLIDADDLPAVDRMCRIFPETVVVVDHCANIGSDGAFREADLQSLCKLARHRRTFVKLSAFYYLGLKRPPYADLIPMIHRVLDAFGPERLMWGSDSPFQSQPPNTYPASLEFIRDRLDFLTDSDKAWLLKRSAEKVFF